MWLYSWPLYTITGDRAGSGIALGTELGNLLWQGVSWLLDSGGVGVPLLHMDGPGHHLGEQVPMLLGKERPCCPVLPQDLPPPPPPCDYSVEFRFCAQKSARLERNCTNQDKNESFPAGIHEEPADLE